MTTTRMDGRKAPVALSALAMGIGLALLMSTGPAQAVDSSSGPSASERMASARKWIESKDWSRALYELNQAVREEPRNADVHNLLGYTYRKRATPDLTKAFEHYRMALRMNPDHKGAHEYIGEAYLMDNKPDEAEKHLAQLERVCGNKTCEEYVVLAKAITDHRAGKR